MSDDTHAVARTATGASMDSEASGASVATTRVVAGGRQRRTAMRYTNLETAAASPVLTKANRQATVDVRSCNGIVAAVGSMQGWRKTMEDRHIIEYPFSASAIVEPAAAQLPHFKRAENLPSVTILRSEGSRSITPRNSVCEDGLKAARLGAPFSGSRRTSDSTVRTMSDVHVTIPHPQSSSPGSASLSGPGSPRSQDAMYSSFAILGVLDGHRGHDAAEFVRQNLPRRLTEVLRAATLYEGPLIHHRIMEAFEEVDGCLRDEHERVINSRCQSPEYAASFTSAQSPHSSPPSPPHTRPRVLSEPPELPPPTSGSDTSPPHSPHQPAVAPAEGSTSPVGRGSLSQPVQSAPIGLQGTTAHVVLITHDRYYFCNVGDSRGYLVRRRPRAPDAICDELAPDASTTTAEDATPKPYVVTVEAMSTDHRASNASERQRVEGTGATITRERVNGKLSVTRALGDFDLKPQSGFSSRGPQLPHITPSAAPSLAASFAIDTAQVLSRTSSGIPNPVIALPDVREVQRDLPVAWGFRDAYDVILVGCDGVWELQSAETIGERVVEAMEELFAKVDTASSLTCSIDAASTAPTDASTPRTQLSARQVDSPHKATAKGQKCPKVCDIESAIQDALVASLNASCNASCDPNGTTPGTDNMSLGVMLVRPPLALGR